MRRSDYDMLTGVLAKALKCAVDEQNATSNKVDGVSLTARIMADELKENDPWIDREMFFREIGRKRVRLMDYEQE